MPDYRRQDAGECDQHERHSHQHDVAVTAADLENPGGDGRTRGDTYHLQRRCIGHLSPATVKPGLRRQHERMDERP